MTPLEVLRALKPGGAGTLAYRSTLETTYSDTATITSEQILSNATDMGNSASFTDGPTLEASTTGDTDSHVSSPEAHFSTESKKNTPKKKISAKNKKHVLDVESLRAPMEATHESGANLSLEWRRQQLLNLRAMLRNHWTELQGALAKDLGKEATEAVCTELALVDQEVSLMLKNVEGWMKPSKVPSPGFCAPAFSKVTPRPRSGPACLVIAPSNYPVCLLLQPLAGSLAAGNPTVLKPSELCPTVSALMQRLVSQYFTPGAVQVVTGGASETTQLLQHSWGLVFFTGSPKVGEIIATAAAATLTPCVLELGGKSPCYVDETAPSDIRMIANRIIWTKTLNAGQTCASIDYLVVHEKILPKLLPELQRSLQVQFGEDPQQSELARLVTASHASRQVELIREVEEAAAVEDSETTIVCGSSESCDPESGYVAPTIVLNPPESSRMLQEEIFGPILPIRVVKSRDEAVSLMRQTPGTPLCLYVFTKSQSVFEALCNKIPSGAAVRNDAIMHLSSSHLPFGGLGTSGYGMYHGKTSFDTFSHKFSTMYRPCLPGADFRLARYHPFGGAKGKLMQSLMNLPDVPVLHSQPLMVFGVLLLLCRYVPALQAGARVALSLIVSLLELVAAFLKVPPESAGIVTVNTPPAKPLPISHRQARTMTGRKESTEAALGYAGIKL
jgi:acyl-CoA reductase-like NAD-dependent aldehyde dehydrogenase